MLLKQTDSCTPRTNQNAVRMIEGARHLVLNVNCGEGHASRYFTNTLRSMSSELLSLLAGNFETVGQHKDTIYRSRRMLQYIAATLSKALHQNTELACVCVAITSVTQQIATIMQALAQAGTDCSNIHSRNHRLQYCNCHAHTCPQRHTSVAKPNDIKTNDHTHVHHTYNNVQFLQYELCRRNVNLKEHIHLAKNNESVLGRSR